MRRVPAAPYAVAGSRQCEIDCRRRRGDESFCLERVFGGRDGEDFVQIGGMLEKLEKKKEKVVDAAAGRVRRASAETQPYD